MHQVWFANDYASLECRSPVQWNFLLETPQVVSWLGVVQCGECTIYSTGFLGGQNLL